MTKFLLIICTHITFLTLAQGYDGKRFTLSYNPAYSFSIINVPLISNFPMLHHKLEFGTSFGNKILISADIEKTHGFKNLDSYYINDILAGVNAFYFRNKRGYFTPIGRYIGLGFAYGTNTIKEKINISDDPNYNKSVILYEKKPAMLLSLYTGHNFVVYDYIYLGYGIQWGVPLESYSQHIKHFGKPYFKLGIVF